MKRIAVLFYENIYCQRGLFNAVRNRIKHLAQVGDFKLDVFVFSSYEPWHIRALLGSNKVDKVDSITLDDIRYNVFWYNYSLIDHILSVKLHQKKVFLPLFMRKVARKIKGYDAISAHSFDCAEIAFRISQRDRIPFFITWHGSDIHTVPFKSSEAFNSVKLMLKNATCNFFVSQALLQTGKAICPEMTAEVLYNGVGDRFKRFSPDFRNQLRKKYQLNDNVKVIAYAGHLIEVKNPQLLPSIFDAVRKKYADNPIVFWIIGSGKMEDSVRVECQAKGLQVVFWGAQNPEDMPQFMNCIDVFVLPSRNEGLPLVTIEALACGANVVGSDVGGVSEAIGKENVFSHGDSFVDQISDRIVYMLKQQVEQQLKEEFHWKRTAEKENAIYKSLIGSKL